MDVTLEDKSICENDALDLVAGGLQTGRQPKRYIPVCAGCGAPCPDSRSRSIRRVCSSACAAKLSKLRPGERDCDYSKRWSACDGIATYSTAAGLLVIDEADLSIVSSYRWVSGRKPGTSYALARVAGRRVFLHHLLMGRPLRGFETDHIDGNGLNNRRANLRTVTISQNRMNSRKHSGCRSKFKGVIWEERLHKWTVRLRSKRYGAFASELEAAIKYDEVAVLVNREFARLNFPDSITHKESV